jgi:hypothetical protein
MHYYYDEDEYEDKDEYKDEYKNKDKDDKRGRYLSIWWLRVCI